MVSINKDQGLLRIIKNYALTLLVESIFKLTWQILTVVFGTSIATISLAYSVKQNRRLDYTIYEYCAM